MGLTPDDIAHRAFTPSADGYHKREVRTFLERIAAEVRGIQAAMPQSGAGVAELSTAVHDQELQLSALQGQLTQAVQELHTATSQLREAQVASAAQLATMQAGSVISCLLYTSPSPRDATLSRMPSSA